MFEWLVLWSDHSDLNGSGALCARYAKGRRPSEPSGLASIAAGSQFPYSHG